MRHRIGHRNLDAGRPPTERQGLLEIRQLRQRCTELADMRRVQPLHRWQELHLRLRRQQAATCEGAFRAWHFQVFLQAQAALPTARWRRQAHACALLKLEALLRAVLLSWISVASNSSAERDASEFRRTAQVLTQRLEDATEREAMQASRLAEAEARIRQMEAFLGEEQVRRAALEASIVRAPRERNLHAGRLVVAVERGIQTSVFCAWRTAMQSNRELAILRSRQLVEEAHRNGLLEAQRRESDARLREAEGRFMDLLRSTRAELSEQETHHQEALARQQAEASARLAQVEADFAAALREVVNQSGPGQAMEAHGDGLHARLEALSASWAQGSGEASSETAPV